MALILAPAVTALLSGCGSSVKTVSVSSSPAETNTTSTTRSHTSTAASTTTSEASTQQTTTQPTTTRSTTSRTSSAPAFVEEAEREHGPLGEAVAAVEHAGYVPNDTEQYRAAQTLRVLLATKSGANGGASAYTHQAFFFVDDKYIGTDASEPSEAMKIVSQSDTEVVLSYELFNTSGAPSGEAEVHFQLDDGKLEALDPIPPTRPSAHAAGRL